MEGFEGTEDEETLTMPARLGYNPGEPIDRDDPRNLAKYHTEDPDVPSANVSYYSRKLPRVGEQIEIAIHGQRVYPKIIEVTSLGNAAKLEPLAKFGAHGKKRRRYGWAFASCSGTPLGIGSTRVVQL